MLVRSELSDQETAATIDFEVALKMRNLDELRGRIARGETIQASEMAGKYFPLSSDYEATAAWIESLGLTITGRYGNHLSMFVRGSVGQVRDALNIRFARVVYRGGEFTSAVSAPGVPQELAAAILGFNGLQPHLRMRPHHFKLRPADSISGFPPYTPGNIQKAYHATGLSVDGTGQIIGIIGYGYPAASDLTEFWQECGIAQSLASIAEVPVMGGPALNPSSDDLQEITLDVEWSSSLAPGATVRVYGSPESDEYGSEAFQQIISDLPNYPTMHQVSVSYGDTEDQYTPSQLQTSSQYLATMAGMGVAVFFSSGDGGSRPDPNTGGYNPAAKLQVEYPASDTSVTGVGGTSLVYSSGAQSSGYSETVWNSEGGASGGGSSAVIFRPSWQTGEGVPAGGGRLVPDVSASADPDYNPVMVYGGVQDDGGGTSWSTPTWAGFCALMNQARIKAGLGPIGALNPRIYPLVGSLCFQDIVSGANGDYAATPGYDECTGLGSPNVGLLVQALAVTSPRAPPLISTEPRSQTATVGENLKISVTATSFFAATYQWQILAAGSNTWVNLTDGGSYSGSSTDTLQITAATSAMGGAQYQCVIKSVVGTTTSSPATLSVDAISPPLALNPSSVAKANLGYPVMMGPGTGQNNFIPVTYRWYHDGQVIPGQTSSSYSLPAVAYSDAGDYFMTETNSAGTSVAFQQMLDVGNSLYVNNSTVLPAWLDAQQQGSIVFFLYATPAQILRYDMNAGAWLPPVALSGTPTAFQVAQEGVYVAFGTTTSRFSPDLSTMTAFSSTATVTTSIFLNGNYVYLLGTGNEGGAGTFTSYNRSTGTLAATTNGENENSYFSQVAVSGVLGKAFGWPGYFVGENLASVYLNADGTVSASSPLGLNYELFDFATKAYVFPGGLLVADNGGTVYHGSDLSLAGALGPALDDLCFLADGNPVAVRGDEVTLYETGMLEELGRVILPSGVQRIFSNGSIVVGFASPALTTGSIGVVQVTEAQLAASPRPVAPALQGSSVAFVPDDAFMGTDGQLYLLSKLYRNIFVWSPATREYANSIPLQGSPVFMSYSATLNRIYLAYADQRITKIDLSLSTGESDFSATATTVVDIAAADSQVYVAVNFGQTVEGENTLQERYLYDSSGNVVAAGGDGYFQQPEYWNPASQAVYKITGNTGPVEMLPISAGAFGTAKDAPPGASAAGMSLLIRFSADGTQLLTGGGIVENTSSLAETGVLGTTVVDAAWSGPSLCTLGLNQEGSAVQLWTGTGPLPGASTPVPGYPLRIWSLPTGQLLVLTVDNQTATMTVMSVPGGPAIAVQPQGQVSNLGSTVVFTAAAPGASTYQWQLNGVNLVDGTGSSATDTVSGANGPQLVISSLTAASQGTYTLIAIGASGSTTSSPAILQVVPSSSPGSVSSISSRAFVGTGDNILIGGFYITGSTSATVLVQAIGPALAPSPYSVSGTLQHPALTIHQNQNGKDVVLYSNTGWGSSPVLLAAAAAAYAQPVLQPGSPDSELLVTLPPGGYTAEVTGSDGGTGVALCGIYQLP
jgi:kumamolisin